jgi:hypothetical protein
MQADIYRCVPYELPRAEPGAGAATCCAGPPAAVSADRHYRNPAGGRGGAAQLSSSSEQRATAPGSRAAARAGAAKDQPALGSTCAEHPRAVAGDRLAYIAPTWRIRIRPAIANVGAGDSHGTAEYTQPDGGAAC